MITAFIKVRNARYVNISEITAFVPGVDSETGDSITEVFTAGRAYTYAGTVDEFHRAVDLAQRRAIRTATAGLI